MRPGITNKECLERRVDGFECVAQLCHFAAAHSFHHAKIANSYFDSDGIEIRVK